MCKNKTMRVAVVLLALTLITSCFVGGTFAKYVTSKTGTDSARVAYWGFDEDAELTMNLFDGTYTNVASGDSTQQVIAPGCSDDTKFEFNYTDYAKNTNVTAPEVGYSFKLEAAVTGLEGATADYDALDANPNFYWTVQLPGQTAATKYGTVAEMEAALESMNKDTYQPGELPGNTTNGAQMDAGTNEIVVGWEWVFEGNADIADLSETQKDSPEAQDEYDTGMGNATDLDDLTLTITITATQNN